MKALESLLTATHLILDSVGSQAPFSLDKVTDSELKKLKRIIHKTVVAAGQLERAIDSLLREPKD